MTSFSMEGMPQGVSHDLQHPVAQPTPAGDEGLDEREPFAERTAFYSPRYVQCLTNGRVAVLDNKALYIISRRGSVIDT